METVDVLLGQSATYEWRSAHYPGLALSCAGFFRLGKFSRLESALAVRAVAEWFILRLTAPAQRNRVFPDRQREFIAQVIDYFDRTLNHQGAVFSTANENRFGHAHLLWVRQPGAARFALMPLSA